MTNKPDPVTRGEMNQFEKRVEESHTGLKGSMAELTRMVGKVAQTSQDNLIEAKLLREQLVQVVTNQAKNHHELKDQVNTIEHRITQDEQASRDRVKELRVEVKSLAKLEGRLVEVEKFKDSRIDWAKWSSRLILSGILGTLFTVLGFLLKEILT
tara:strand:- start:1082 stop:1546 length:465 start_codon:yes stop_codon:yes gene_type:complete